MTSQQRLRRISDLAVLETYERGMLDLRDFYSTSDDYRYRFESEAKQRFLDLLREQFNSGAKYKRRALKWDTLIEQKTSELGRYLVGRSGRLDFTEPSPVLRRTDTPEVRRRILSLSQAEARTLGTPKSTLHYLRRNANEPEPFRVCRHVLTELETR